MMLRLKIRIPDIAQVDVSIAVPLFGEDDKSRQILVFARPDTPDADFPPIEKGSDWLPLTEGEDFTREVT